MSAARLTLQPREYIVTAWAEDIHDQLVRLVKVLIRSPDGDLRIEAIQGRQMSPAMLERFDVSELAARQMREAVEAALVPGAEKFWRLRGGR